MDYGIKIKIKPTREQCEYLTHCCESYHNMRNWLVAKYKNDLPNVGKHRIIGYSDIQMQEDYKIKNVPKRLYRSVIYNYSDSLKRFYTHNVNKPPKFHKYNSNKQSFCIVDVEFNVNNYKIKIPSYRDDKFTIPKYITLDKYTVDKFNITKIKNIRYTKYKNKWYVSGIINIEKPNKIPKEYLGLDWGIKNFMTTSEGKYINYPKSVLREYQRIRYLQHYLSLKKRTSNNYKKLLFKLRNAYIRMTNIKNNSIEKETKDLVKKYNICIENISMSKMMSTTRKYKKLKRNFILSPYSIFINKLEWKCEKYGSYFIKVDPNYTSMSCCKCGTIKEDLKLSDRVFICECCGNIIDRDLNAAINIRERGKLSLSQ